MSEIVNIAIKNYNHLISVAGILFNDENRKLKFLIN
jgi:hypothetical protein